MFDEAVKLFSKHYGIWGEHSHNPDNFPVLFSLFSLLKLSIGKRAKSSTRRPREQILPDPSKTYYVKVAVDGKFTGNAFACRWENDHKIICWVTQLVVHRDYRQRD